MDRTTCQPDLMMWLSSDPAANAITTPVTVQSFSTADIAFGSMIKSIFGLSSSSPGQLFPTVGGFAQVGFQLPPPLFGFGVSTTLVDGGADVIPTHRRWYTSSQLSFHTSMPFAATILTAVSFAGCVLSNVDGATFPLPGMSFVAETEVRFVDPVVPTNFHLLSPGWALTIPLDATPGSSVRPTTLVTLVPNGIPANREVVVMNDPAVLRTVSTAQRQDPNFSTLTTTQWSNIDLRGFSATTTQAFLIRCVLATGTTTFTLQTPQLIGKPLYAIDSFFNLPLELSIDNGVSWRPANSSVTVRLACPCIQSSQCGQAHYCQPGTSERCVPKNPNNGPCKYFSIC
jgi:hypothetical protein